MTHVSNCLSDSEQHPQLIGIQAKAKCLLTLLFGASPRKCLALYERRHSGGGTVGWQGAGLILGKNHMVSPWQH